MNKRIWIIISAILMMLIGIVRGIGGIALFAKGNQLDTGITIVASQFEIKIVAVGLLTISILLIVIAISLLKRRNKRAWNLSWFALILFLLGGVMNGFLLFGQPIDQGQKINIIAAIIVAIFLFLGKGSLKSSE